MLVQMLISRCCPEFLYKKMLTFDLKVANIIKFFIVEVYDENGGFKGKSIDRVELLKF